MSAKDEESHQSICDDSCQELEIIEANKFVVPNLFLYL